MGVFNYEEEHTSTIPPTKLFKAFILDADNLFQKVAPQAVKGSEIVEGNGGVGTIKKITFGEGSALGYVKHKIDGIDEANLSYSYSIIEGDALGDTIEKISYEIKLVAGPDGGSIVNNKSNYYTKGDHQVDEAKIKEGKEKAHQLFKLVESYLKDHPDLYN